MPSRSLAPWATGACVRRLPRISGSPPGNECAQEGEPVGAVLGVTAASAPTIPRCPSALTRTLSRSTRCGAGSSRARSPPGWRGCPACAARAGARRRGADGDRAAEACLHPLPLAGFAQAMAHFTRNDAPHRVSRPFDRARDGFVIGEGSATVVLERGEFAAARGAVARQVSAGQRVSGSAGQADVVAAEAEGVRDLSMFSVLRSPFSLDRIGRPAGTSWPGRRAVCPDRARGGGVRSAAVSVS